jgi:isocitrate/isopropylmalate dehydrogenase
MKMSAVAVIPGDGIGNEVVPEVVKVLETLLPPHLVVSYVARHDCIAPMASRARTEASVSIKQPRMDGLCGTEFFDI